MSQRAHFWLRIAGLAAILAAQFGPRLWTTQSLAPSAQAAEAARPAADSSAMATDGAEVALMPASAAACR